MSSETPSGGSSPTAASFSGNKNNDNPSMTENSTADSPQNNINNNNSGRNNMGDIEPRNNDKQPVGERDPHDLAKTPLCICPSCHKVLTSVKSLFGHYGRSHRASVNQDSIRYMCPFCDQSSERVFDVYDDLESHVGQSHPECTLLSSFAETPSGGKGIKRVTSIASSPSNVGAASVASSPASSSAGASSSGRKKRRSGRNPSDNIGKSSSKPPAKQTSNIDTSSATATTTPKAVKQQYSHPLCKCPSCPKILPPQGLFGHFGRVHSGQLGQPSVRFEWKNVHYACPYCPKDVGGEGPPLFGTIELIEAHVNETHDNCHLTRPNAISPSAAKRSTSPKPDAVVSMSLPARKSRGGSRRSSVEANEDMTSNDDEDDDKYGSRRKSQRSRRPVDSGVLINSEGGSNDKTATTQTMASSAAKKSSNLEEDEAASKPLYRCPDCDKTNLTKNGLHAHYGMVHGGKVDLARVKCVRKPKKATAGYGTPTAKTGPWSDEEHAAFMEGVRLYGNRWKKISVEFVPTRDAKQIGSHALNYFTTRGEWHKVGGRQGGRPGEGRSSGGDVATGEESEAKRRSKRENSGKNRRLSSGFMDVDVDDLEEGMEEVKEDELQGDDDLEKEVDSEKDTANSTTDPDDGNSSHCIVCFEGGNIVCCSKCPRAYHPKCLAKDGQHAGGGFSAYNIDLLPNDWQCNRCKKDDQVMPSEEIGNYAFGNKKIRAAYAEFKECNDYNYCCALLSHILDILKKLMAYDYGYVFNEPVEVEDVPDYLDVVQTPMDYSTVTERLDCGNYVDLIASEENDHQENLTTMEKILLHAICDIELVHHNCRLYNKEGSSIYRIGDLHASKWNAYLNQYILERLPERVEKELTLFRHSCVLKLQEENHSMRKLKKQRLRAAKRAAKEKAAKEKAAKERNEKKSSLTPATPSSMALLATPSLSGRKRKASVDLDDEDDNEEEDHHHEDSHDDEEMEEEDELPSPKRKAKRAKHHQQLQDDNTSSSSHHHGHSKALLFTEDQMRSLEHVFFTSAKSLGEEFDELDACSALTSLIGCSPSASDRGTNTSEGKEEGKENPSAAVEGPKATGAGAALALKSARSEESLMDLPHKNSEVSTSAGGAAVASAKVPKVITSGPAVELGLDVVEQPPTLAKTSSCSSPAGVFDTSNDAEDKPLTTTTTNALKPNETPSSDNIAQNKDTPLSYQQQQGTTFQRQWYERLNELKKYKIKQGTAVVSATSNDKLYHWRLRQRKRYHLTLFRMPHLKKQEESQHHEWGEESSSKLDKNDKEWLLTLPEMKGVFSLSGAIGDSANVEDVPKPVVIKESDVENDEKTAVLIRLKHREQLYCPPLLPIELLVSQQMAHSSLHSNSLFWDECLEELRFFEGEYGHTIVPRDFPHNSYLAVWVEIQRAKYLLQNIGLFAGLTGSQMLVLDELNFGDLSSLPTVNSILASDGIRNASSCTPQKVDSDGISKKVKNRIKQEANSPERKSWTTHATDFEEWYLSLTEEEKPKARELLPRVNWPLYSWCWRQCNASSAVLCGTPNIRGINMTVTKLSRLSSAKFFHAFPYNERDSQLVCEDEYEGSDAFDSTFRVLEEFSIKYGTTHLPDWYDCDRALRMWVMALENGLAGFVKGEPCVLSPCQIEKLILIGFCNDREGLPNLSKGDVVWLKMFVELKRHLELFGVCNVSPDFPLLHQWIADQKELFRLSRMGKEGMNTMNASRLKMLMEAGVDFFTGECLPGVSSLSESKDRLDFKQFELVTSSPTECFPAAYNMIASSNQTNHGWNFQRDDNYWKHHECLAKFEMFKARNGHSLVLASDDIDVYWWFVEKRGKALLSEINSPEFREGFGSNGLFSHSILRYVNAHIHADGEVDSKAGIADVDQSMFLWLHYCERLMMFKAREGHCKIPREYPDTPLRQWLAQQQELIYLYSTEQSIKLRPVQLKILYALGVHGSERHVAPPKLSSRMLKRKYPSRRKDKKQQQRDVDKSKS